MLFDLIGLAIEGAIELVGELFEEVGQDSAAAAVPTDSAVIATPAYGADFGGTVYESTNYAAEMDNGINPDAFDPAPARGPYTP